MNLELFFNKIKVIISNIIITIIIIIEHNSIGKYRLYLLIFLIKGFIMKVNFIKYLLIYYNFI
jgi:hypothetical protein